MTRESNPEPERCNPERSHWMSTLSRAAETLLEAHWARVDPQPGFRWLRRAESGLVMLRGRTGGNGQAFNLGEMTATRATVLLEGPKPIAGFGYVAGRAKRHAELAALFDALLQDEARRPVLLRDLIAPIDAERTAVRNARAGAVAATRVNFTTMVRGDV